MTRIQETYSRVSHSFRLRLSSLLLIHTHTRTHARMRYALILDAGSGGTRARIFQWRPRTRDHPHAHFPNILEVVPPNQAVAEKLRDSPGISAFANNPTFAASQVQNLIAQAANLVPKNARKTTPLYLMATGGLRLLASDKAKVILAAVHKVLSHPLINPFDFRNARTITGEEEALFGWLSATLLAGKLRFDSSDSGRHQFWCQGCSNIGWLDMGGASAQIAYLAPPKTEPFTEKIAEKATFSHKYSGDALRVVVHSHARLGRQQGFLRSCRYLAKNSVKTSVESSTHGALAHPCLLAGDEVTIPSTSHELSMRVFGLGQGEECVDHVRAMLDEDNHDVCVGSVCGIRLPRGGHFLGAGNYYYAARQLGLARADANLTIADFGTLRTYNSKFTTDNVTVREYETAALSMCRKSVQEAKAEMNAGHLEWLHGRYACFSGVYIAALLRRDYGFDEGGPSVSVLSTNHGSTIDWTLGALVYEVFGGSQSKGVEMYGTDMSPFIITQHTVDDRWESMVMSFLPADCRYLLSLSAMPLVCILPLSWCFLCFTLFWFAGCACVRTRWSKVYPVPQQKGNRAGRFYSEV